MDIALKTAIISSGAAFIIAVVGIVATGIAQARATKIAHQNALELFQRQVSHQADIQRSQAEEQIRLAHLDDRKHAYLDLMSALDARQDAQRPYLRALKDVEEAQKDATLNQEEVAKVEEHAVKEAEEYLRHAQASATAANRVQLIAPISVANAGFAWMHSIRHKETSAEVLEKRKAFVSEARADLKADLS